MRESSAVVKQKTVPTKRLYVRKSPRRRKYHSLERGFHFAEFARGDDPVNYVDRWGLEFDLWYELTAWHYEDRDARNVITETVEEITREGSEWREESRAVFHQGKNDNIYDKKYTHPDGREVVIDGATGKIDTNPETRGTYNYVDPGVKPSEWYDVGGWIEYGARAVGHFFADVLPYLFLGNNRPMNEAVDTCKN